MAIKLSRWAFLASIALNVVGLLCIIGLLDREATHRWIQELRKGIGKACGNAKS